MSAELIARMRAARKSWLELAPGKQVQIIRPAEADLGDFVPKAGQDDTARMLMVATKYVTDWQGFTEADLLGESQASAIVVPFDPTVWAEVVRDNADWLLKVVYQLMEVVSAHTKANTENAKN